MTDLRIAHQLIEGGQPDEGLAICSRILDSNPNDGQALFLSAVVMQRAEKFGLAQNLLERVISLHPERQEPYINLAMCHEYRDPETALRLIDKAIEIDPSNPQPWMNKGILECRVGKPERGKAACQKALRLSPDNPGAHENLSIAHIMLREWKDAWEHYQYGLGSDFRRKLDYGVPDWDGKSPGTVVVYGEQGIGDEILFASCIPDAKKHANICIDTQSRLKGLFHRSFGEAHGTRFEAETTIDLETIDYQCALGDLPRFYRTEAADFPGTPYLTPDPERCTQWRALLDTFPGRKIGLAWSGGSYNTMSERRSFTFDTFSPLLDTGDTYISLEYADPGEIPIIHWPRAVEKGVDFDETVALISELDLVICVTTTVMHAAGAVGTPCWVLAPKVPPYICHMEGNMPWYGCVETYRQKTTWEDLIKDEVLPDLDGTSEELIEIIKEYREKRLSGA